MLLSVITVCRNSREELRATLASVAEQTARDEFEYVVIDGASDDGSIELIGEGQVDVLVSEPDEGIYHAMNKGLERCAGEWVWFLNAGDAFATPHTARRVLDAIDANPGADIIYADVTLVDKDRQPLGPRRLTTPDKLTPRAYLGGMRVSHQAFIARRSLAPRYDTQYRWAADFQWCLSIVEQARRCQRLRRTVVLYLDGGATKSHIPAGLLERLRIQTRHFGLLPALAANVVLGARFALFRLTHNYF